MLARTSVVWFLLALALSAGGCGVRVDTYAGRMLTHLNAIETEKAVSGKYPRTAEEANINRKEFFYHCPALYTDAEFDLIWVGPNGKFEKGEGDDLRHTDLFYRQGTYWVLNREAYRRWLPMEW